MNGYESLKRVLGGVMIALPFLVLFGASVLSLGIAAASALWIGVAIVGIWIFIAVCLLNS